MVTRPHLLTWNPNMYQRREYRVMKSILRTFPVPVHVPLEESLRPAGFMDSIGSWGPSWAGACFAYSNHNSPSNFCLLSQVCGMCGSGSPGAFPFDLISVLVYSFTWVSCWEVVWRLLRYPWVQMLLLFQQYKRVSPCWAELRLPWGNVGLAFMRLWVRSQAPETKKEAAPFP